MIEICNALLAILTIFPATLAILLAIIGTVGGIKRGAKFTLIRLFVILGSFTAALIVSILALPSFDKALAAPLTALLSNTSFFRGVSMEGIAECAGILAGAIVCPFLFCLFYVVIDLVFHIVFHAVTAHFRHKEEPSGLSRLGGAGLGFLSALLVSIFLLAPLSGTAELVSTAADNLRKEEFSAENTKVLYEFGDKLQELPVLSHVYTFGGRAIYDALAVVRFEDGAKPLDHEIAYAAKATAQGYCLATPLIHYGPAQISALRKLADYCEETVLLPHAGGETVSAVAAEMAKSGSAMSFALPDFGPYLSGLADKTFEILATTSPALIAEDLRATADILEVLYRYGVLIDIESDYATLDNIAKPGFAEDLNDVLHTHPRLEPLRDEIGRIALLAVAGAVNVEELGELEETTLAHVATEITHLLNDTGSKEELADRLHTFLDAADASVDFDTSGLTEFVTDTVLHHFDGKEYVTAEDLRQLILDYRDELIAAGYPVY